MTYFFLTHFFLKEKVGKKNFSFASVCLRYPTLPHGHERGGLA